MDRLMCLQAFVRAVETGSFSAVAREMNTGQPTISRQIAALETQLGTRLLHRSTRALTLTPEGERFYAETRPVLDALAEAETNARGTTAAQGLLRVACPVALGRLTLLPLLKPFLVAHPGIVIDLQISDRMIDLVEEGVDVAIRVGALRDSALMARRLGTARRVCVATRAYLRGRAAPQTPAALRDHNCIVYTLSTSGSIWRFGDHEVAVSGNFRVNSPEGVRSAVLDDLGIGLAPSWLFDDAIADGRVVKLLAQWPPQPLPIHALYPARRLMPRRSRVFMDFLAQAFARDPGLADDPRQPGAATAD